MGFISLKDNDTVSNSQAAVDHLPWTEPPVKKMRLPKEQTSKEYHCGRGKLDTFM
jgi:hypothetical protein